jgi:hypothetical protein
LTITTTTLFLLLIGIAGESGAQSKIPIPEFYGIYMVSDGKLINLDRYEAKSQNRLKAPGMTLLSSAQMGIAQLSGLTAAADSYVLVYLQGPTRPMNLGRFEFVERLAVGTGTPLEPRRVVDARVWQLKANVPVNVGPVAGKQDLIRLVPVTPLTDGVYAWYVGSLEVMGIMNEVAVCDFVVGKVPQTPPSVAREVPQASSPQPGGPTAARRPESVGLDERFEKVAANLLSDPSTQDIRLTGLTPSPHASGRIAWNARAGAGLLVSGLPPLPPGKTYQLWAIVGNKPPVSAGVFTVDGSGLGGLSVRPLPGLTVVNAIAVTLEPAGGLPQPSGEMYLISSIGAAQTPAPPGRGPSSPQSPSASDPSASAPAVGGAPSVAGGGPPLASLPPQQPGRPRLTDLTRGTPNDGYFVERQKVFNRGYEPVWAAAKKVLERHDPLNPAGDRISTENREQGTLITEPTIHARLLAAKIRRQYFIVIDSASPTNSTVVTVKGFCYEQRGQQWVSSLPRDRCSAGFIQDLDQELAKSP